MNRWQLPTGLLAALIGCQEQKPVVFSSSDEWHMLSVYPDSRFSLMDNGFDTWRGTCHISQDTLRMTYDADQLIEQSNGKPPIVANQVLVRTIVIDRKTQRVRGLDGQQFCGAIGINEL